MLITLRTLALGTALAFLVACQPQAPEAPAQDPAQRLEQLIERYLADYWSHHPERATRAGLSAYNDRLPALARDDFRHQVIQLRALLDELDSLDSADLSTVDQRVDHRLLRQHARVRLVDIEVLQRWQREPRMYLPFNAFTDLLLDTDHALDDRAEWLLARLKQLPLLLDYGRANLDNPPQRFTLDAIQAVEAQRPFFTEAVADLAEQVPKLADALTEAGDRAAAAIDAYLVFLRDDLLPRSDGSIAIGQPLYEIYLREIHGLEIDAETLLKTGQRYFDETLAMLEAQAERMSPGRSWQEITEQDIRPNHPQADDLLDAYCREIQRSRAHVIEQGLATIPGPEEVRCIHSDPSQRAFSPFGTFRTPGPFTDSKIGYLILHPVPDNLSEEEQTRFLRAHDHSWIQVIAPHEAYPGHHLQALLAQQHQRPLRKVYSTPVFTEGWGLYTEELMYETGFFRDQDATRLTQLRLRLWRAARVLLDARIHTDQITVDQARHFLADHVGMTFDATAGETNIYVYRPSYAIGYVIGYYEMMALREDYRQLQGEDFDLKAFHDRVLRLGSIPFRDVRELLDIPLTGAN
ncbi:MAG: DUF885 domain-containing protein [Wenzhouxiangella sp.]|nr:MAG: DUF885 domain-containing protein [Wenzhouxiangella sp.]